MASLALGVAGAAVGSFFGPLGTSIGWGVGAALGGALFGKGPKGADVATPQVQTSSYGWPIPIIYGTDRRAGNEIWTTEFIKHEKRSGGKGGPKTTTITHTRSFAHQLCETSFIDGSGALVNNPIVGIGRIWRDGTLVRGEGGDGTSLPITIYLGTEDQEPDPTMEADKAVGNVPAYRGCAYVVFTDYESSSTHNWTYEVIASGGISLEYYSTWPIDYDYPIDGTGYSYPALFSGVVRTSEGLTLHRYRSGQDYGVEMGTSDDNVVYYDQRSYDLFGVAIGTPEAQTATVYDTLHAHIYSSLNSGICYVYYTQEIDCGSGLESFATFAWLLDGVITYTPPDLCFVGDLSRALPINAGPVLWNGFVYATGSTSLGVDDCYIRRWPAPDGAVYVEAPDPTVLFNGDAERTGYPTDLGYGAAPGDISIGDDGFLYWLTSYAGGGGDGTRLFKLDAELNLIQTWHSATGNGLPVPGYGAITIWRGHIITYESAGQVDIAHPNFVLWRLNADGTTTWVDEILVPPINGITTPLQYIGGNLAAHRHGILTLGTGGTTWGAIVENVSEHVGFDIATEVDVSELTDPVRGYTIGQRMSGRAAIEVGMPAYQHGAVESGLQVKFPKWGGDVVATVTADDLGARDDSSDPVDPLEVTHIDDKELPRRVEALFINFDMDYQEGNQHDRRTVGASELDAAVNIPIVLNDAEAKKIAEVILYNAWIERDRYKFSLPRKWAHLEPTDVVNVDGHAIRLTNKTENGYTHIDFEGVATRTNVFVTAPVAPAVEFVPPTTPTLNRTDLLLLDLPLVRDTDFNAGFYGALSGFQEGAWPGASLFKSIDGGVNYESIYATVDADTLGVVTSGPIADFLGGNIFDESTIFTVRLTPGSGELASSNELGVLNGANMCAVGSESAGYEILQFKTATLDDLSDGGSRTYTLSGLLRGRRGTEWAIGTHGYSENFIFLPAHNIEGALAEIHQARLYKAVTSGGLLANSTEVSFTNTGVALTTYAPVHLGGGRNAAGDITLNWTRRDRRGRPFLLAAPQSEASEQYVIATYSSSSYATQVYGWLVSGAATTTFTAADQTTYHGSPQSPLYWDVAQIGAAGSGYVSRGVT